MIGENPYYHRGPIKETKHFYGRDQETAHALQMVKRGQSVSVIGPRRIGKTSLLFHLSDAEVRVKYGLVPEWSSFVYIDGQMLGGLCRLDILRLLLHETIAQTSRERIDIPSIVGDRSFELTVRKWAKTGKQLVYLIDEFECLGKNPNLDTDFFSFLRSLAARFNVAYITASQVPLLALSDKGGQLSSPFFNFFVQIHLGLFDEDEARTLIREPSQAAGVEFSKSTEDFILDLAGPHPFFLQVACFNAFEMSLNNPPFGKRAYRQLKEDVQTDLECHFEYFASGLSKEERRVLVQLLDTGQDENPVAVTKALERKCLVIQHDSAYKLVSRALACFIRQRIATTWSTAVVEGERRMATVLFVDVVGFTPMTERSVPEDILEIIKSASRMFVDIVDRYGGQVANFGGDSVMALFGIPGEHPDDATYAVRAALEIQDKVTEYAHKLKQSKRINFSARVGLDTGVVVVGEIGGAQRAEFTALGDAVNLAKRMETLAEPGTIVISDHTYQQILGRFITESLGQVQVKGKSRSVRAYRVLGEQSNRH